MSSLYALLHPLPLEVILYLMARSTDEEATKELSTYITKLRGARTALKGDDLMRMGVKEGPRLGELLNLLFKMKLDEEVKTKKDEAEFVRRVLAEGKTGA
jgi:tRNA nucleotidyltransferase (CCA-adding enzyme)